MVKQLLHVFKTLNSTPITGGGGERSGKATERREKERQRMVVTNV